MTYQGLNNKEVLKRQQKFGKNIIAKKNQLSPFILFFSQFKSPLVYIVLIASGLSFLTGEKIDGCLLLGVIAFDVFMGFYQEYRAQKILQKLSSILKNQSQVIRNQEKIIIESQDLVPGDLVILSSGDRVPADGIIIESFNLLINESILTGEGEAIIKDPQKEKAVFMGTTVLSGRGIFLVKATGLKTKFGKISQDVQKIGEAKTPLQQQLKKFGENISVIILLIAFFIFLIGIIYQHNFSDSLRMSIVLAVAAIPEGLPIAITVILAIGMQRVLKRQGLVNKLLALETLGLVSVICVDKTGTLTKGEMIVKKSLFIDEKKAVMALILNNNQRTNLETAIWQFIRKKIKGNPQKIINNQEKILERPFNSEDKIAFCIAKNKNGKKRAFLTGAPEIILKKCLIPLDRLQTIQAEINLWASQGIRIIGVAYKENGDLKKETNFIFLGILGIEDPIRKNVSQVIKEIQKSKIKFKIITGDYRITAEKIVNKLGISLKKENVIEGEELEKISQEKLLKKIDNLILFARTTPHQKLKIIQTLQIKGELVAMTGDGINDLLAIKKADIGIAVSNATDASKEAADLVLLDNSFSTIIASAEEGRLILSNIKKVVCYVLSNSFSEIILITLSIILKLPTPLTVAQILWFHLICDGLPDIALGFENRKVKLSDEDPYYLKKEPILGTKMKVLILLISSTIGILTFLLFKFYYQATDDLKTAQTLVFASICMASLIYVFSFKDLKNSLFKTKNFFENKILLVAFFYGIILTCLAVYLPSLNKLLGTQPLLPYHWIFVFGIGIIATFWVELIKKVKNKNESR